jgi:hypothetical protein
MDVVILGETKDNQGNIIKDLILQNKSKILIGNFISENENSFIDGYGYAYGSFGKDYHCHIYSSLQSSYGNECYYTVQWKFTDE